MIRAVHVCQIWSWLLHLMVTILAALAVGGWMAGGEKETIRDIGARVPGEVELSPDSFIPMLSKEKAVSLSREDAAKGCNIPMSEVNDLPVDSTVARFTGETEVPGPDVSDHKVRVVVFRTSILCLLSSLTALLPAMETLG